MTRASKIFGALALVLALGASGIVCQRVADRGRFAVAYSTYGSGPDGTRALYLLAQEESLRPVQWASDFNGIPERAMLVALGGCESMLRRPVSRYDEEELGKWIERGGVLLVAGVSGYLPEDAGVRVEEGEGCDPGEAFAEALEEQQHAAGEDDPNLGEASAESFREFAELGEAAPPEWGVPVSGGPLDGLGAVPLRRPGSIHVGAETEATEILRLPSGPAGVVIRRGEGALVVLSTASLFQNRDVATSDGGVVFTRLARAYAPEGPVVFDEYHLGVGEKRSLGQYLRSIGGGPIAIQILIVVLFVLWRVGARFGAVTRTAPEEPAGTASYVGAVGALYQKSGDSAGAALLLLKNALHRVAAYHHLAPSDAEGLARALEERKRSDEAGAVRALGALGGAKSSGRELVEHAKEIDALLARAMPRTTGEGE
jgi:hypothetical protein